MTSLQNKTKGLELLELKCDRRWKHHQSDQNIELEKEINDKYPSAPVMKRVVSLHMHRVKFSNSTRKNKIEQFDSKHRYVSASTNSMQPGLRAYSFSRNNL